MLENRVAYVSFVKVRLNDILISGKNGKEHLENLRQVLSINQENELRLKLGKCVFMTDEVIYFRFKNNKVDVTPVKEKIE